MKNADLPAMPCGEKWKQQNQYGGDYVEYRRGPLYGGLTKREMFAMAAMQGILSGVMGDSSLHETPEEWVKDVVESSAEFADALLAELERTK